MLKRCFAAALVLGLTSGTGVANAAVLWVGDFETNDLTQWDSTNLIMTGDRLNLILQGDKIAEGTLAAEITLRPDVIFEPYNQSRVEVKHQSDNTENGMDSYYAWSFMVPADAEIRSNIGYWESNNSFQNTMCFYIEPGEAGGTDIVFGTGNLGQTVRWTESLTLNVWHRIAIHNHWSQDEADGRVNVWYDGTQVVTDAVATKYNTDTLFFQMGLHRSDPADPVQVIYLDAAMEADTLDDILVPLPDPNAGGSGGTGGMAGGGGGGAGGAAAGSGGSAGVPRGGSAGAAGSGGMVASGGGGTGGASGGQAGTTPLPQAMPAAASDTGSCAMTRSSSSGVQALALLLGLGWLARRGRRAAPASR